ncbi:hypothetical protein COA01_16115 [Bacillus cereus]|uniref:DUF4240 domain-containing protein n=1 Tax=Bacillus cereus TaxID=1396 RepID=UPI000BFC5B50|nr:DUF4240 domain-containing protein [Bacillus cereus]PGP21063.1 hypothetical protein COA01_16115 [Bacillus cereus]
MNEREFWDLLNESVTKKKNQYDWLTNQEKNQYEWLTNQLAKKKVVEIIAFHDICTKIRTELVNNMEIFNLLKTRVDACSSDSYYYFCEWLISMGEGVVTSVVEDRKYLIQLLPEKAAFPPLNSNFTHVASDAYEKKRQNVLDDVDTSEDENKFVLLMTDDFYQAINKVKQV